MFTVRDYIFWRRGFKKKINNVLNLIVLEYCYFCSLILSTAPILSKISVFHVISQFFFRCDLSFFLLLMRHYMHVYLYAKMALLKFVLLRYSWIFVTI